MLQVRFKKSKTDQEGKGMLIYVGKTNNVLCPASAMLAYLSIHGTKEGPLFHFKDGRALTKERLIDLSQSFGVLWGTAARVWDRRVHHQSNGTMEK